MFFDESFCVLKEFCKQFNILLPIRSQRPKTTGICDKDLKILLAHAGLTNGGGSLPIAITASNQAIRTSANVKP